MTNGDTIEMMIDKDKFYNLSEIASKGLFPSTKDLRQVRRIVKEDRSKENVLMGIIVREGHKNPIYKIKGANIIKFNKIYAPGLALLARKSKTTHNGKRNNN